MGVTFWKKIPRLCSGSTTLEMELEAHIWCVSSTDQKVTPILVAPFCGKKTPRPRSGSANSRRS